MTEQTSTDGQPHLPVKTPTTLEEHQAALFKLQRDHSEALLLLSRMNQRDTEVLLILTEKGMITREEYSRIHSQVINNPRSTSFTV
jgi:hypothetical protein